MKKNLLSNRYESVEVKVRILLFLVDIVGGFIFSVAKLFNGGHEKYEPQKVKKFLSSDWTVWGIWSFPPLP
jgi:hypothetical protein